jgi:hypothetical protein
MRKITRTFIGIIFLIMGLILTLITAAAVLALFLLLVGIT